MTDSPTPPNQPQPTPPPPPEPVHVEPLGYATPGTTYPIPAAEIEQGKAFAVLSYVLNFFGFPFFVVPLITRDNDFALYHAKQSLMVWIAGAIVGSAAAASVLLCIGFVLLPATAIFLLVLNILGLVNAAGGQVKPLPLIGQWGEEWFKGITKIQK